MSIASFAAAVLCACEIVWHNLRARQFAGCAMQVDPRKGEVAGVFELVQPSDTDMGAKVAKEVMVQGLWYGQLG